MDHINDRELCRVAIFALQRATKRLAELSQHTRNVNLQARLLRAHALLIAATQDMSVLDDLALGIGGEEVGNGSELAEGAAAAPRRLARVQR